MEIKKNQKRIVLDFELYQKVSGQRYLNNLEKIIFKKLDDQLLSKIDFSEFQNIKALKIINSEITDLGVMDLSQCQKLKEFYCLECSSLNKFDNLNSETINKVFFQSLKNLEFIGANNILPNLKNIRILDTNLQKIEHLELFPKLEFLKIRKSSISIIENIPSNVVYLDLHSNSISLIENISHLSKLKTLILVNNQIASIKGYSNYKIIKKMIDDKINYDASYSYLSKSWCQREGDCHYYYQFFNKVNLFQNPIASTNEIELKELPKKKNIEELEETIKNNSYLISECPRCHQTDYLFSSISFPSLCQCDTSVVVYDQVCHSCYYNDDDCNLVSEIDKDYPDLLKISSDWMCE